MKLRIVSILSLLALLIGVLPLFAQSDNECEVGFRPFVDVTGVAVCVPNLPERIVAIHDMNAGAQVLALGGPLVGLASRVDGFRADVTRFFDLEGIVDVGNVYEPNLERILELQPDLIVHEGFDGQVFLIDDDVLASLRAIAPVVAIDPFRPVEDVMADYQELLGEAATLSLEEQQETFEALLMNIRNLLGEDWQSITVSFVNASADGSLQAWGTTALVPLDILTRVGVNWVAIQQEADLEENGGLIGSISMERINEFNADLTLVDVRFSRDILEHPLYQQLTAVRAGQVILLDEPFNGTHYPNYIAVAQRLLSDLTALGAIDPNLIDEPESEAAAAACQPGFRLITHAMGETCVPGNAERVIALEWTYAENLLALGLQPAGVADIAGYNNWVRIPLTLDASVADVGTRQEPNLEAIAALEPDLILAVSFRAGQNYELLSAIAPTLVFDAYPTEMTHYEEMIATFNTIAQATGREAEAEDVLQAMRDTFAAANDALNDAGRAGETFILAQTFASGEVPTFRLFTDNALAVQTLVQIGLVNAWDDAPQQFGFTTVDFEAFGNIGDTNFFYVAQDDYHPTLTGSPLWGGLPFVQSGRAYSLGGDAWLFGGPLSMQVVVDTVLTAMGIDLPTATITP